MSRVHLGSGKLYEGGVHEEIQYLVYQPLASITEDDCQLLTDLDRSTRSVIQVRVLAMQPPFQLHPGVLNGVEVW